MSHVSLSFKLTPRSFRVDTRWILREFSIATERRVMRRYFDLLEFMFSILLEHHAEVYSISALIVACTSDGERECSGITKSKIVSVFDDRCGRRKSRVTANVGTE